MKFSEFRQHRVDPDQNVFGLVCEDSFLVDESREIWKRSFSGNWEFEKYSAKEFEEIPASRLLEDARTPSLFSRNRALIVTNAEKLTKARIESLVELRDVVQSSLKSILVTATPKGAEAWGGPSRIFPVIEIDPVRPGEAARWLVDRHKIAPEVARHLVDSLGTDLRQLNTEIQKLETYTAEARPIEIRDVDILILRAEQFGPFELDDALLARDYKKAVRIVSALLDDGVEPLIVLSRIVRVWRQLLAGKGMAGRKSAKEIAMAVGAPVWKANDILAACRQLEWKRLGTGFQELLKADRSLKTSAEPEIYFHVLLWKLIG